MNNENQKPDLSKSDELNKEKYIKANNKLNTVLAEIALELDLSLVAIYRDVYLETTLTKRADMLFIPSSAEDLIWANKIVENKKDDNTYAKKEHKHKKSFRPHQTELRGISKLINS